MNEDVVSYAAERARACGPRPSHHETRLLEDYAAVQYFFGTLGNGSMRLRVHIPCYSRTSASGVVTNPEGAPVYTGQLAPQLGFVTNLYEYVYDVIWS